MIINSICAIAIIVTLMVSFIGGSSYTFMWMYITALVLTIVFLAYNNWVSDYLNRNR